MSVGDWLDERTGHRAFFARTFDERIAGGARWGRVFGAALAILFLVEAVTGVALMLAYNPSATTAWSSVAYIQFTLSGGWLVRGVHHFGSQAIVVLLALHIVRSALAAAYRRPREVTWMLGVALLMVTLAFPPTGNFLRFDQHGYWSVKAELGYVGTIPGVGSWLERVILGGDDLGHLTLARFDALHTFLLPLAAFALLAAHVAMVRRHGRARVAGDAEGTVPWYPTQAARDLGFALLVLLAVVAFTVRGHGAPLEAPADPASDFAARPDWYFLPLYAILRRLRGPMEPLGVVLVPTIVFGFLFAFPFLGGDGKSKTRARVLAASAASLFVGAIAIILGSVAADAKDEAYQRARADAARRAARAVELMKGGVPPDGPLAMMKRDPETRGRELFASNCASCHRLHDLGPEKGRDTAPSLDGYGTKEWVLALFDDPDSEDKFKNTPFKGMMLSLVHPPKDPEAAKDWKAVTPADRDAMATFLAAEARGESGKGMPGEKLVSQRCTSCHRFDGETLDSDSMGPELRGWASASWIAQQIANPGGDKTYPKGAMSDDLKGHMPRYDDKLSAQDIDLLAKWLVGERR